MKKKERALIIANTIFLTVVIIFTLLIFYNINHKSTFQHKKRSPIGVSQAVSVPTSNTEDHSKLTVAHPPIESSLLRVPSIINSPAVKVALTQTSTSTYQPIKLASVKKKTMNAAEKTKKPTKTQTSSVKVTEIYQVPKGYCAITIDDGPSDYTKRIVQLLNAEKTPAAFFFIGNNVKQFPSMVTYASEHGIQIGDHSVSHPNLNKLSGKAQTQQILQAKSEIEALSHKPVTLFRPPYGNFNNETKAILAQNRMKLVLWNDDPRDWAAGSSSTIIKTLSASNLSGKVIILHDKKLTCEALPAILKLIKKKGLKVTSI